MSRGPLKITQGDITRIVRGVVAAGVEVMRVEVDIDGRINVFAGKPSSVVSADQNALDRWMATHAAETQGH